VSRPDGDAAVAGAERHGRVVLRLAVVGLLEEGAEDIPRLN
jgi:hypothetical protein